MLLNRLALREFRNYSHLDLELPGGLLFFVGDNGTGKTSLLEAAAYLTTLRSMRGAPHEAIPKRAGGQNPAEQAEQDRRKPAIIRGEFQTRTGLNQLAAEIPPAGRLKARLNNKPAPARNILEMKFPVTVFLPTDLELVSGAAAMRRSLFDRAVLLTDPAAPDIYQRLEKVLKQRSAFLKLQKTQYLDREKAQLLDIYDGELVKHGEKWAELRAQTAPLLQDQAKHIYRSISSEDSNLEISYSPSWQPGTLEDALSAARGNDLARRANTVGPHKDDLEIHLNGLAARFTASRGEKRSIALSLIFGIHNFIAEKGETPIILLDDVLSEFDPKRAHNVLQNLPAEQVFITAANLESVRESVKPPQSNSTVFEITTDVSDDAKIQ